MKYPLITAALAPVLIYQGRQVKRNILKLEEPAGARNGCLGEGKPLQLLIVGDSAAAGVGVAEQSDALSGQLSAILAQDRLVNWTLIARSGDTIDDLLLALQAAPSKAYDIAVISIGANDVTHGTTLKKWRNQQQQLLSILQDKFCAQHVVLSSIPPMHLFPALPQPLRWYMGMRAKQLNKVSQQHLTGQANCQLITLNFPKEDGYIAVDGFHPSGVAYRFWAQRLSQIITNTLPTTKGTSV